MWRRRPRRRPPPRRGAPGWQGPALRALSRAHRLMETSQYAQAYPILMRLADGAAGRGMPGGAANLYLQAGRAQLELGNAAEAVELAERAVHLLVGAGQTRRVGALLPRMVHALEVRGHHERAAALRARIESLLGGPIPDVGARVRGTLPAKCPSCSGPVRADEVVWIDDRSAECVYCGSVVHAEGEPA